MATPNDLRAGRALAKADRVCEIARVRVEATNTATGAEIAPRRPHAYPTSAGGASHGWRGAFRAIGGRYGDR